MCWKSIVSTKYDSVQIGHQVFVGHAILQNLSEFNRFFYNQRKLNEFLLRMGVSKINKEKQNTEIIDIYWAKNGACEMFCTKKETNITTYIGWWWSRKQQQHQQQQRQQKNTRSNKLKWQKGIRQMFY